MQPTGWSAASIFRGIIWAFELRVRINRKNRKEQLYNLNEPRERLSDRPYKEAFVDLIKSRPWDWFFTIPISECPADEVLLKRLRRIENELCGKFLANRCHKLTDHSRFRMAVAFEGERRCGTRNAHVLAYVPTPTKIRISREMLVNLFPEEFRSNPMKTEMLPIHQVL